MDSINQLPGVQVQGLGTGVAGCARALDWAAGPRRRDLRRRHAACRQVWDLAETT